MLRNSFRLAAVCVALWTTPALAQTASSSANALELHENVAIPRTATANISVGPLAQASGSAPPAYNVSNSLASVNESASLSGSVLAPVNQSLQTGLLTSNATGSAVGAQATSTVNNLTFDLTGLIDASIFSLGATTIQSTSQANSIGGLDASGNTTIEGLNLFGSLLSGVAIDASLFSNPDANTVLFNALGLSIILNQQTTLGDGITSTGISTNAIYVGFNNFVTGTGLVNGSLTIGHSEAFASAGVAAVPEPATWAMMLIGFGAIGFATRRAKRSKGALLTA